MFDSQRSKICGSVTFRSHLLSANQQQQNRNGSMYTMCASRIDNSYSSGGIWKQSPHMTTSARNFCSGHKIESPAAVNSLSNTMGNLKSTILPVYNSVKEFFTKFIKSSPEKQINEYNSEPNMNINKIEDSKKLDLKDFCEVPAVTSSVISLPKEKENQEILNEVEKEVIKKTEVSLSEHKKRKNRRQKRIQKKLNKSGHENSNNANKKKKTFNPDNFYQKGKNMNKNKKEKNRHAIECSIHEDFDNNFVIKDEEIQTPIFHATKNNCFLVDSLKQVYSSAIPSVSSCKPQFISFTVEDFPTIQPTRYPRQQQNQSNYSTDEWNFIKNNQQKQFSRMRQYSECDSEDSFIVFSEESPKITPSFINRPITLCQKFQQNFSPRHRNISECSDDSFVICFEDDPNRAADENFTYSSGSDSESDSETEGESVGHPPDSGFEEKKVNIFYFLKKPV